MASREKDDFEKYKKMYQERQKALASNSSICTSRSGEAPQEHVHPNATGVKVPCPAGMSSLAPISNPTRTIIDKRTYEQVYKEQLNKRHKGVYFTPDKKKPVESQHVPQQSSLERQGQFTAMICNTIPHEVSNGTDNMKAQAPQPTPASMSLLKPAIAIPKSTMEVISYQKSHPNAYAKRLIEITKSGMKKMEIPSTTSATHPRLITNHNLTTDIQARASPVPQTIKDVQNLPRSNFTDAPEGKPVQRPTFDAAQKKELYLRLQAQEERRRAAVPSLETFAQNGEEVRISKHRSNVMLSIVNPTVSPPAPTAHVYDAPEIRTRQVPNVLERFDWQRGSVQGGLIAPPPAHTKATDNSIVVAGATANSTTACQDHVLNLDTKQNASLHDRATESLIIPTPVCRLSTVVNENGGLVSSAPTLLAQSSTGMAIAMPKPPTIPTPACRSSTVAHTNTLTTQSDGVPVVNRTAGFVSSAPTLSAQSSTGMPMALPMSQAVATPASRSPTVAQSNNLTTLSDAVPMVDKSVGLVPSASTLPAKSSTGLPITQELWDNFQNYSLQQTFALIQALKRQSIANSAHMSIVDHLKLNMLFKFAAEKFPDAFQLSHAVAPCPTKAIKFPKRKNASEEVDPTKKRKPGRPKHSRATEPFMQNEPCYKVSSRLPRCRECGRSAATRSRHALNIFCRFFAFRKLKYNEIGKLEVAGFADPYLDPKEADISLWSANLKRVPADLTIEKSKFLLGQVGYKFCELFHQEKEAHFEHLSTDKTIAWKQAVQGVREMCDVCQTTLFNHHWVCSSCGFVVCIDCYKGRKNGTITAESTTKDKDTHGWLLCSSNGKEPHGQDQLMLTQIIPSNCLYKLVRQMHGICALLEIPLNCECPLSKEPRFRKIKDKLEFIYPITVNGRAEQEEVFYDFSGPIAAPSVQVTRMVSITIKSIAQNGVVAPEGDEPIGCTIEFSKQFHEDDERQGRSGEDGSRGTPTIETVNNEKQSYSFEGFQYEIRADGDHFDESMYKIPTKDKTDAKNATVEEEGGETDDAIAETSKLEITNSSRNGSEVVRGHNGPDLITSIPSTGVPSDAELKMEAQTKEEPIDCADDADGKGTKVNTEYAAADAHRRVEVGTSDHPESNQVLAVTPTKEITNTECCAHDENGATQLSTGSGANSSSSPIAAKTESVDPNTKPKAPKEPTIPTVPYNEEGRYKPSPPMDPTTFAMIVKQMVKFDKTVDIFSTFQRHMACDAMGQLDDFVESISLKPERVRQFLVDFLNDFVFLRGQNSKDDLTNERQILDYNRYIKEGLKFRNKGERKMHMSESSALYPEVAHEWLCNGKLLRLLDPLDVRNYQAFHDQWERGQPVMVSAVSSKMNMDLWIPESFGRDFGEQVNDLVNCFNGKLVRGHPMRVFWEGFEQIGERLQDERDRPMMLKLKDWPPGDDFAEMMPTRFYDLMKSLPLAEYTRREGRLNLASRLCSFFVRPDLGPKMYSAYGSALHPNKGTTNLHLDISDAVNVMVYVGVPTDVPRARYNEKILEVIDTEDCDYLTRQRIRERKELPGALWHIYHAQDADNIRKLLNKIELERGGTIKANHDPIHDQKWYLDRNMRRRLQQEYGVEGYAIVQCSGDAIFIPAGAPHQVRNLHNCIKVAEDFVSPENISYCFKLTNEFRHLSKTHSNHEDKLQIKNIIYHAVKDAVSSITNPLIMMAGEGAAPPVGSRS